MTHPGEYCFRYYNYQKTHVMINAIHFKLKKLLFVTALIGFIFPSSGIYAQDIYQLDLQKSIEIAKEKSHRMLILKADLERAGHELKSATSRFRTHVDLNMTVPNYTETINQFEDSTGITFYPVQQLRYQGDLLIYQPLPTDGRLFVQTGLNNILDYDKDERLTRMNASVGFNQPLEAFYAYNRIKSEFKRAQLNYELSLRGLKREELDLIYQTSSAFYQLVANWERMNIDRQIQEMQQEAYDIAQSKYEAGLIREVEALQMEVDLGEANNNYDLAEVDYISQMNIFKQQLGLSLQDSVILISDMTYDIIDVDEEEAVMYGLSNRTELREREIGIELSKLEIKRIRANGLISGDIQANYDFIGVDQQYLPYSFGESMGNSWSQLQDRPGNFGIALRISMPLFDWGENRSLVRAAESSLEMNRYRFDQEKINIEREIRNTVKQLNSSLKRLQLLEQNVLIAEKSFDISRQRFSNGDIDSQSLALDRTRLNAAYQSHLDSYIGYKLLLADIMRKTFYDFENGEPIVQAGL